MRVAEAVSSGSRSPSTTLARLRYGHRRAVRLLVGVLYPPFALLVVVATGNHFFFDALTRRRRHGGLPQALRWCLRDPQRTPDSLDSPNSALPRGRRRSWPPRCSS